MLFKQPMQIHLSTKRVTGHSLIELMVVLSLVGLVVLSTVPSYSRWVERYRLNRSLESWYNALHLAKTAAYTMHRKITVCPLERTTDQCSSWDQPYDALKIAVEKPTIGQPATSQPATSQPATSQPATSQPTASQQATMNQPPENILHIIELPSPKVNTRFTGLAGSSAIIFDNTGRSLKWFTLTLQQGQSIRQLVVSRLGRITLK